MEQDEAGTFTDFIEEERASALRSYRARPENIRENAGQEQSIVQGGYRDKQVQELIQNAVDALEDEGGKIQVVLTNNALYVANDGLPFDRAGVRTLLHSNMSDKRDDKIGRFGLGFKSVLQVSDRPQIFSEAGSFGFDVARSRAELEPIRPGLETYPALRLPQVLDLAEERARDSVLNGLIDTAVTVVRLPLARATDALGEQVQTFPYRFILFTPKVTEVVLDDRIHGERTAWSAQRRYLDENDTMSVTLRRNTVAEHWLVVFMNYAPSARARADAGSIHARQAVPVSWAIRTDGATGSRSIEGLWNYFPTHTEVTIPGLINAPFKMNDDRVTVLECSYNEEILSHALARLMFLAVPHLRSEDAPAGHFRVVPARGREDTPWMRDHVINPLMQFLATIDFVPDLTGELRRIAELKARPTLNEGRGLEGEWTRAAQETGVTDWVHEDALETVFNGAFINRLNTVAGRSRVKYQEWIEGLLERPTIAASAAALELVDVIRRRHADNHELLTAARDAHIVLLEGGSPGRLADGLYFPDGADPGEPGIVSADLVKEEGVSTILRAFGVKTMDGSARLGVRLDKALKSPEDGGAAESFWHAAEQFTHREVITMVREEDPRGDLLVKTQSGHWVPRRIIWRSGTVLDADREEDARIVLARDHRFLASSSNARQLGIPDALPDIRHLRRADVPSRWTDLVKKQADEHAVESYGPGATAKVTFAASTFATSRLQELDEASAAARAAATEELLSREHDPVELAVTSLFTGSHRKRYVREDTVSFLSPDIVWMKERGVLRTSYGLLPVRDCCASIEGIPDDLVPVPIGPSAEVATELLDLPSKLPSGAWRRILSLASRALDVDQLHELYGHAARAGVPRQLTLVARIGGKDVEERPLSECLVPGDEATGQHLERLDDVPFVGTGKADLDRALIENWKLRALTITWTTSIRHEDTGTISTPLKDRFPYLRRVESKSSRLTGFTLQPVGYVSRVTSNDFDDTVETDDSEAVVADPDAKTIYYRSTLRDSGLLARILRLIGSRKRADDVLETMQQIDAENRRTDFWDQLSRLTSDQDRVVHMIGEEGLRQLVPDSAFGLLRSKGTGISVDVVYRMAQNVHGGNLWKAILGAMPEDDEAREWFKDAGKKDLDELGFTEDMFARTSRAKPSREEFVGPVDLPALHDYQHEVSEKILTMLSEDASQNRGFLQLPTGAGKTRVAVQSLIKNVRRKPDQQHLLVWIAGQDELCEQAVEAWSSAWPALGTPGARMAISRLWGGRGGITEEDTHLHVVVTTYQTLSRIARSEKNSPQASKYQWLSDPDAVIIDEAHGAITKSYTDVLRWFHRSTAQRGKPLLGLSATPFRGTSEEETKRLVQRFSGHLIEPSTYFTAGTAHAYLQQKRVLARVRQEELEGTTLRQLHTRPVVDKEPAADTQHIMLESRIDLIALAHDEGRNQKIIQHILEHSDTVHHAIVFAASVEHAQALAAVLDVRGVPSAAIHGGTPGEHRRRLIQRFKDGELQVLTNFDVLSQGFDAPKVDTVYMCRPTFSPNKYLQMIGRGLRGPLNGGSEEVLIVNVRDNLEQFGANLAYTEFEYLWEGGDAGDEQ